MTYLIFTNFFKCTYVILIDYFLFIAGRLFKYLFLRILIIWKHFCELLSIIFVMNFAKIQLRNRVMQNDVTLRVSNSKIFTEILLSSY